MEHYEAIANLNRKMDRIENLLRQNNARCEKMSNHIDFVERIYEYVKRPLFFLTNRFYAITEVHGIPAQIQAIETKL
tara:strand:+ start:622 stop:852 length:231 start_codon:yes stop_codon:yes gene_type:complete